MFHVINWQYRNYTDRITGAEFAPRLHQSGRDVAVLDVATEGDAAPYEGSPDMTVLDDADYAAAFPNAGGEG